jgi:hypothetical protein
MRARRAAAVVGVTSTLLLGLSACGNSVGAQQVPAQISGTVTWRPPCPASPTGQACSQLESLAGGAVVRASGKDGVHEAVADSRGRYHLSLIEGLWSLRASRAPQGSGGPIRQVDLAAGQQVTLDLSAG